MDALSWPFVRRCFFGAGEGRGTGLGEAHGQGCKNGAKMRKAREGALGQPVVYKFKPIFLYRQAPALHPEPPTDCAPACLHAPSHYQPRPAAIPPFPPLAPLASLAPLATPARASPSHPDTRPWQGSPTSLSLSISLPPPLHLTDRHACIRSTHRSPQLAW